VCDAAGCTGKLADGRIVSYVLAPDAFEEDCGRAAMIVDRKLSRSLGALSLARDGDRWELTAARPAN